MAYHLNSFHSEQLIFQITEIFDSFPTSKDGLDDTKCVLWKVFEENNYLRSSGVRIGLINSLCMHSADTKSESEFEFLV